MLFQKKIDRAQKWLRRQNQKNEQTDENQDPENLPTPEQLKEESQEIKLEKGELPLMIFLAVIIIVPVCLIVLLAICSFVFFL